MLGVLLFVSLWSPAAAAPPTASDAAAIQRLIHDQLGAFSAGDAAAAYAPVSPSLRQAFPTPEGFLEMVRGGYGVLINPRSVRFEAPVELPDGAVGQLLHVVGADGRGARAIYLLERQPDGRWRTSGCLLMEPERVKPALPSS